MFNFVKWMEGQIDAATKRVAAKSELNGLLVGRANKPRICFDCGKRLGLFHTLLKNRDEGYVAFFHKRCAKKTLREHLHYWKAY